MGKHITTNNGGADTKATPINSLQAFTPEQVAERICWHPNSVRLACRRGRIAGAVRFGKSWRIPATVLARLLETGMPSLMG